MTPVRPTAPRQAGSAALELVIIVPLLLLVLALGVGGGRLALARAQVDSVAGQAARAASMARSPGAAAYLAGETADSALSDTGLACVSDSTSVDTSDFGPGGSVRVTVTCVAALGHLLPGALVGSHSISATASAVIDRFRAISG